MRSERYWTVQADKQYVFIHQCINDVLREELMAVLRADIAKQQAAAATVAAAPILTATESLNAAVPSTELLDTHANHDKLIIKPHTAFLTERYGVV